MAHTETISSYNSISEFYQTPGIPLAQETEFTIHAIGRFNDYYLASFV
ncbi:MAG TPA: hypothetical protein P5526_28715 [Anaerolineae bacterium]|nr:hypothetical protein [Anaerolineae bacterium]